ncbi:UNVERIFIED_CONTAM: hypothetical protein Scaly_0457000 [Sesamum calycinum]|uniref:HAT C-terminal dimerisation domain-containing protein n=1 Tax=Sesamum calycinum TaxID=2727403 RepID=A0AAW2SEY1_9LAMI
MIEYEIVITMVNPMKEKFDKYWEECYLVLAVAIVFDPSPKLPILAKIARDILAMPATTVESKAACSIRGLVIDESRACLLPNVVEALVVADDWVGSTPKKIVDNTTSFET